MKFRTLFSGSFGMVKLIKSKETLLIHTAWVLSKFTLKPKQVENSSIISIALLTEFI
jgi:hypothetical protein